MKILQISKKFPIPKLDGETIAIIEMGKALIAQGCEVSLLTMNTSRHFNNQDINDIKALSHYKSVHAVPVDNEIKFVEALSNLFSSDSYHISRFISDDFEKKLIELLEATDYDIVQLETLYLAPYVEAIKANSNAMVVMRAHNIEHEIWDRISKQIKFFPKKWYLSYLSKKLKNFEIQKLNDYDFLVAITDRDLKKFQELGYKNGCIATPVGFEYQNYIPDYKSFEKEIKLSFIGSLDWMPNIEGLNWFFENVWPSISAQYPDIQFHFTGRNAPSHLKNIQLKNVFFHPDEACAHEFINAYSIMIVPLLAGSGIRIKILEGMSLGKVIITTNIGLEGIPAKHKEQLLIANTPEEFLAAIGYCVENKDQLISIGQNARQFIKSHFDSQKLTQNLIHAYKHAIKEYNTH